MLLHGGPVLPICVYAAILLPLASGTRPQFTADANILVFNQIDPVGETESSDDDPFVDEAKTSDAQLSGDQASVGADPGDGKADPYAISRRPSFHEHKADEISFRIEVIEVYGLKLSDNTFVADIRFTFQWKDMRATAVCKEIQEQSSIEVPYLTLSEEAASKKIWMPDMVVSNQAMTLPKTISSTVKIRSSGIVTHFRRQLVSMKNKFDTTLFPYDKQTLKVFVSSSRYMPVALTLKDVGTSQVWEDAFKGSGLDLKSNTTSIVTTELRPDDGLDTDGFSRSCGMLEFEVERDPNAWNQGRRTAYLLAACGYAVFWTPMETRFEIRVSLLAAAVFSLLEIRSAYLGELEGCNETSLGEIFYSSCMLALCCAICFNVCIEYVYIELKRRKLAERLHEEVRFTYLLVFLALMLQCFHFQMAGWESSVLICILFICRCHVGVRLDRATDEDTSAASATTDTGDNESKNSKP